MIFTKEEFLLKVEQIKKEPWYKRPLAFGIARINRGQVNQNKVLQATYPVLNWNENFSSAAIFMEALIHSGYMIDSTKSEQIFTISDEFLTYCIESFRPYLPEAKNSNHKNVQLVSQLATLPRDLGLGADDFRVVFIFEDKEPLSVETIYLKLSAISQEKVSKGDVNLSNMYDILENVAWISNVPVELGYLRANEISLKLTGKFPYIDMVSKLPRYLAHTIPQDDELIDISKKLLGE